MHEIASIFITFQDIFRWDIYVKISTFTVIHYVLMMGRLTEQVLVYTTMLNFLLTPKYSEICMCLLQ